MMQRTTYHYLDIVLSLFPMGLCICACSTSFLILVLCGRDVVLSLYKYTYAYNVKDFHIPSASS